MFELFRKLWNVFIDLQYSVCFFLYVLFKRKKVVLPKDIDNDLWILVNGPSLKDTLEKQRDEIKNHSIMCVNMMACTSDYEDIKPKYYAVADIKFWQHMANCESNDFLKKEQMRWDEISASIVEKTKWDMYLFVPYLARKNKDLEKKLNSNPYIHTVYINSGYDFKGFKSLHYWCWKHQLCAPLLENSLVFCIYIGIICKFKNLYLFGCDHTFFGNFHVDSNNKFMYEYRHSYDGDSNFSVPYDSFGNEYTVGRLLGEYYNLWNIYSMLEEFARRMGTNVYNCTEISLIDVFMRKKVEDIING